MAYSKTKLKSSGDKASPCSRSFWIRNYQTNIYLYGLHYTFNHILISLTCFMGCPNSMRNFLFLFFIFWGSASCWSYFIKVISRTAPCNNSLFYILYIFATTCFGPCWPSSGRIHKYFTEVLHSQWIRCFVLLGPTYCICLANTGVVFLICVCELSKLGQITSLLNVKSVFRLKMASKGWNM
jgi:hypothetical protein